MNLINFAKRMRALSWRRGYDMAAGELLRSGSSRCIDGLYNACDIEGGSYAEGIRAAVADWNKADVNRRSKQ